MPEWPAAGLLDGTTMVIAGVGPGLGSQVARLGAASGAAVMLAARTEKCGPALVNELQDDGRQAAFARCDITSDDECAALVLRTEETFGGIDSLVLNAMAGGSGATLEEGSVDDWRDAFEVNLFGSLRVVQAAIPALKRSADPSVTFVGSQIVRRVLPGRGPYAASKAALMTAAQVLATELGPHGVRVNTVVPGRMWGPPLQSALPRLAAERGRGDDEELERWIEATALKRLATDEECARSVVFLASMLAAAITGQTLDANAGETMRW